MRSSEGVRYPASFLVGVLFGFALLLLPTEPAFGSHCPHFQVETVRADNSGNWTYHRGTRAVTPDGMRVVDSSPTCDRVSAIGVFKDNNNFVEFGWSEWNAANGFSPECGAGTSTSVPRRLVLAYIGGTPVCSPELGDRPPISDGWHDFEIRNADLDGDFDLYVDGTWIVTYFTGWNTGLSLTNTERFHANDSAYGNFKKMQIQTNTGWVDWSNRNCFLDSDFVFDPTTGSLGIPAHVVHQELNNNDTCP